MVTAVLGFLGLIFGSFVNAFVWRLREQELLMEKKKKPSKKQLADLSVLKGRSMCPDCKHELAAKDLVPVFSWIYLRGKCRYCAKPISWQYPLVEAATAVLFAISYAFWPQTLDGALAVLVFAIWLIFVVMFMALAVYDLCWYLLPDRIVFPLILLAVVEVLLVAAEASDWHVVLNAILGALAIAGTFWLLFQVSAGKWIGGGDVKLAVVLGLLAGTPLRALLVLFFSSIIGTVCSIPILLRGKKAMKVQVPFGPFLLAATAVVVLFGTDIIDWYTLRLLGS
jgi:prepilin signal peptidase PulO-like enzyme (type II secretory pathway)